MEEINRLRSLMTMRLLLAEVFESMLLMWVTTIASVTEQNKNNPSVLSDESSYYEVYSIVTLSST